MMTQQQKWQKAKKILCVRLDNMGDVIMTSPALRAVKESAGNPEITLLTSTAGALIVPSIPAISDCLLFDPPWMKNDSTDPDRELSALTEKIRERNFDAAILFTVYSQSPFPAAMICYQAGIPLIAGYSRENPYALMSDWIPDQEPLLEIKHEVVRQLELVNAMGFDTSDTALFLAEDKASEDSVNQLLLRHGIPQDRRFILVNPGVSEERRRFSTEIIAEAVAQCRSLYMPVLITGSYRETPLAQTIVDRTDGYATDLSGSLQISELVSLIKKASVLISNNTGPVHIAAAVGTPVVALYALTNPQHTPWRVPHIILPFEVPREQRSKNVIIEYAHNLSFRRQPASISGSDIYHAVKSLVEKSHAPLSQTDVLTL